MNKSSDPHKRPFKAHNSSSPAALNTHKKKGRRNNLLLLFLLYYMIYAIPPILFIRSVYIFTPTKCWDMPNEKRKRIKKRNREELVKGALLSVAIARPLLIFAD
jgi:hypothetical protein